MPNLTSTPDRVNRGAWLLAEHTDDVLVIPLRYAKREALRLAKVVQSHARLASNQYLPRRGGGDVTTTQPHDKSAHRRLTWRGHGGVELVADDWGLGDPVILLHGGGQTRHSWKALVQRLSEIGRRVIAPDLRGHGDSGHAPDGDYGTDAYVGDLHALLDVIGRPAALVGASLGGIIALVTVGEDEPGGQDIAAALVLLDVAPRLETPGTQKIFEFMTSHPNGFENLAEAKRAVEAYRPGQRDDGRPSRGLIRNLREGTDGRLRWHWDPQILNEITNTTAAERANRLAAAARRVRVPTLLVRGADSDVLSTEGARQFLDLVPHSRYLEIAGTTHMVAGDSNDDFAIAVIEFLSAKPYGSDRDDVPPTAEVWP